MLGAGASKTYGFPIGTELVDRITTGSTDRPRGDYARTPEFRELATQLKQSDSLSVDRFLEHRPSLVEVGKLALADALLSCEASPHLFDHDFRAKRNGNADSWYRYVLERMMAPFNKFGANQVAIVTFNYDRSLEHYLFTALRHRFFDVPEIELVTCLQTIEVVHVHGQLGRLPWQQGKDHLAECPYDLSNDRRPPLIASAARGIKIISDPIAEDDPEFQRARLLIAEAKRVFFLGFGFDATNMSRLGRLNGENAAGEKQRIVATCFGFTEAEKRALELRYKPVRFVSLDCYNCLRNDVPFVSDEDVD